MVVIIDWTHLDVSREPNVSPAIAVVPLRRVLFTRQSEMT